MLLNKLQQVQNAAAQMIKRVRKRVHVTYILKERHWIPVYQRYIFYSSTLFVQVPAWDLASISLGSTDSIYPTKEFAL